MFVNCLQIDSWLDSSSKIICRFLWWITISLQIIWAVHSEQSQSGAHAVWVRCRSAKVTLPFSHWKTLCNKPTAVRILNCTHERKTWKFTPLLGVVVKFRTFLQWTVKQYYRKVNSKAARSRSEGLETWANLSEGTKFQPNSWSAIAAPANALRLKQPELTEPHLSRGQISRSIHACCRWGIPKWTQNGNPRLTWSCS